MIEVRRRARGHPDRGGDPLDGLVNLFDLGIVLAVAFMLAVAVVRPGQGEIVKKENRVRPVELDGRRVVGEGRRVGSVYRLEDGRTVFVRGR